MSWAREYRQSTALHGDDRLSWLVRYVATTWTLNSAGRAVVEKFGATFGSKAAERTELFEVVVTPDEWNRESVEQQE